MTTATTTRCKFAKCVTIPASIGPTWIPYNVQRERKKSENQKANGVICNCEWCRADTTATDGGGTR